MSRLAQFLCVTANYAARAAGVGKLMRIDTARELCPDIVLLSGEDLTPYREASSTIFAALSAFGPCQKLGLDEFFVDVGAVSREGRWGSCNTWAVPCHVHIATHGTRSAEALEGRGTNYRPQDLRATTPEVTKMRGGGDDAPDEEEDDDSVRLLRAASHVAAECKRIVREHTGLTVSIGVATSRVLAKLTSGLHKPDGLTVLPRRQGPAFLAPLDVRVLPGVGSAAAPRLREIGVSTIGDLREIPHNRLHHALTAVPPGGRAVHLPISATRLLELSVGVDTDPVVQSGPPRSLGVEDSFKGASSFATLATVLRVLAPDLLRRVDDDRSAHARRPRNLTVRLRHAGSRTMNNPNGSPCSSAVRSTPFPHTLRGDAPTRVAALIDTSMHVLRGALKHDGDFCLTLLGLGVSSFESAPRVEVTEVADAEHTSGGVSPTRAEHTSGGVSPTRDEGGASRSSSAAAAAAAEMQRVWRGGYGLLSGGVPPLAGGFYSKAEERRRREAGRGVGAARGDVAHASSSAPLAPPSRRVVLHLDVDNFYCAVETADNPALIGRPLAVAQGNAGGFVALSAEAKAAGLRKGDGVGARGRAEIRTLREMGSRGLGECRRMCPQLVVLPMRTEVRDCRSNLGLELKPARAAAANASRSISLVLAAVSRGRASGACGAPAVGSARREDQL